RDLERAPGSHDAPRRHEGRPHDPAHRAERSARRADPRKQRRNRARHQGVIMIGKNHLIGMILGASVVLGGCAAAQKPVETSSRLGSVIVYRNGVAYFERYAEANEKDVSMRVPTDRVDDFLKSLSIVDEKTGEALPISYPTMETYDGYVEMKI